VRPFERGNGPGRPLHVDGAMTHQEPSGLSESALPERTGAPQPPGAHPNNLPAQLSSFVGRRKEIRELEAALASTRLLTLTGAGGCGKSRLALRVAADALDRFPDGIWWIELATLGDPDQLGEAIAGPIGIRPLPGVTTTEALLEKIADRRSLIVLDSCEHLLQPCAELAEMLLRSCPELTVMPTSREPLGLPGETSWRVPSLSVPPEDGLEPIDALTRSDAARLFIERVRAVLPSFEPTEEGAPAIARICRDLDGIPLAIELAAARMSR
jgi:predicted ATPase